MSEEIKAPETAKPPETPDAPHVPVAPPAPTRPEYIPEKFWDAASGKVRDEAMAKSYAELERKFQSGAHQVPKAPDGYAFKLSDDLAARGAVLDEKALEPWRARFHAAGLSVEQANLMLGFAVADAMDAAAAQPAPVDPEAVARELGENGATIRDAAKAWAEGAAARSNLGDDEREELSALLSSAPGVRLIEALRREAGGATPATARPAPTPKVTRAEIEEMMKDSRYGSPFHREFTNQVNALFGKLSQDELVKV